MNKERKIAYASPVVKVAQFNVEKGYAGSTVPGPSTTSGSFSAGGWAPYGG